MSSGKQKDVQAAEKMLRKTFTEYVNETCPEFSEEQQERFVEFLMEMAAGWGALYPKPEAEDFLREKMKEAETLFTNK